MYDEVYVWYTYGIRMVYAWYTHGIRMVYAWYVPIPKLYIGPGL